MIKNELLIHASICMKLQRTILSEVPSCWITGCLIPFRYHFQGDNILEKEDRFNGCQELRRGGDGAGGRKVGVAITGQPDGHCHNGIVQHLDYSRAHVTRYMWPSCRGLDTHTNKYKGNGEKWIRLADVNILAELLYYSLAKCYHRGKQGDKVSVLLLTTACESTILSINFQEKTS